MDSQQEENAIELCSTTKEEDSLLSASTAFFEEEFDDDEVFLDDSQSVDMETSLTIPARLRRTSDVIDCVGEATSSIMTHVKRHSFPSTSGETTVYSATSKATNIVEINKSRRAELTTESFDLGYSSPGAPFSSRSVQGTWFKFSPSQNTDSIDAKPLTNK